MATTKKMDPVYGVERDHDCAEKGWHRYGPPDRLGRSACSFCGVPRGYAMRTRRTRRWSAE